MKEQLRDFLEKESIEEAVAFIDVWCIDAENSCIKELKKIANNHSYGLLNYYFHRISCGLIKEINNKIKTLKWQAYGFREITYFKLGLYHLHSQSYSFSG